MNGTDLLRKRMAAALDAGRFRRYFSLRRAWIASLRSPRVRPSYGVTRADPDAFANVEAPAVSPTLDR